jgi:ABC-type multidrug transport system ATPase subunit
LILFFAPKKRKKFVSLHQRKERSNFVFMKLSVNIKELRLSTSTGERELLHDINFTLQEKSIYTILGKNGSGKTTLIKSLGGLNDTKFYVIKGTILADSIDIITASPDELIRIKREKIKLVFQDAINSFDPLRKLDYYFKRFNTDTDNSEALLNYFLLPSLKELGGMYPYELSGGMAQRLSFVLALLMDPELLILDEPTSGIDPAIANLFLLKIKEFADNGKKTVLLVTQDISFAEAVGGYIAHISEGTLSPFIRSNEYFNSNNALFNKSREML